MLQLLKRLLFIEALTSSKNVQRYGMVSPIIKLMKYLTGSGEQKMLAFSLTRKIGRFSL